VQSEHRDTIARYLLERRKDAPTFYLDLGWVDERILNPYVYANVLEDLGFECIKLRPTYFNLPVWAAPLWSVACTVPWVLLRIFPAFELSGERRRV